MTIRAFDVMLAKKSGDTWATEALALPKARLVSVADASGSAVPFEVKDGKIIAKGAALIGRIELPEDLVETSTLEKTKFDLEREKLASDERSGRRTLWFTLVGVVLSSAVTIAVALITKIGPGGPASDQKVPPVYKDLVECRESLNRLGTLSQLDQQTLPDLKGAIGRSLAECRGRLDAAISAAPR